MSRNVLAVRMLALVSAALNQPLATAVPTDIDSVQRSESELKTVFEVQYTGGITHERRSLVRHNHMKEPDTQTQHIGLAPEAEASMQEAESAPFTTHKVSLAELQVGTSTHYTKEDGTQHVEVNKPACQDVPGWKNTYGSTCATYNHYCANGAAKPGQEYSLGGHFMFPERNCCVCGGGSRPTPQPTPQPTQINATANSTAIPEPNPTANPKASPNANTRGQRHGQPHSQRLMETLHT
eukprot:gnl/TRDRNA2_/TRDRNA2_173008_c3_seq3.p1 gnl/TRDRNA2_/TRDRNA2_173008_c3~~gnl/TRDRNA2_/TRDRNA2_173008_c3_seq3.p1  ORF type:complete len:238 (-),score=14.65 gnl/TRDRNA2_/TRDRNA2_173008_c3_seq3:555-1268(-)